MTKKVYNKVIRVKIPEIIENSGKNCIYDLLNRSELETHMLIRKMREEISEVYHASSRQELIAELGDVYEVFLTLCAYFDLELDEVKRVAEAKNLKNGKFITDEGKFMVLKEVSET